MAKKSKKTVVTEAAVDEQETIVEVPKKKMTPTICAVANDNPHVKVLAKKFVNGVGVPTWAERDGAYVVRTNANGTLVLGDKNGNSIGVVFPQDVLYD